MATTHNGNVLTDNVIIEKMELEEKVKEMAEEGQRHEKAKDHKLAELQRKEQLLAIVEEHMRETKGGSGVVAKANKQAYLQSNLSMADRLKRRAATRSRTLENTLER